MILSNMSSRPFWTHQWMCISTSLPAVAFQNTAFALAFQNTELRLELYNTSSIVSPTLTLVAFDSPLV